MLTQYYKILILEDNQSDADLILRELKKNAIDFSSEIVENRKGFEQALDNFKPDIIISDYSLPAFDGLSAFHIKQRQCPDVPFIIVSGTLGEERAVELIKTGVTDYTLKDKLFTLVPKISRALKEVEELKEKRITDEELRTQHDKLRQIAFLQSHQVRVPIAHILGLYGLFKFDNPADPVNAEVLNMLKTTAESFDNLIREIVEKTDEISRTL